MGLWFSVVFHSPRSRTLFYTSENRVIFETGRPQLSLHRQTLNSIDYQAVFLANIRYPLNRHQ